MIKRRIDLFGELMDTHKVKDYGIGTKPDVPSKFWPDADSNTFDEIANWKNDLRKEQQGKQEFIFKPWGIGSSFENSIDIDLLLRAFYNVSGEYYESEVTT